jgi:monofunctional glycosyltransferase
VALRKWWKSKRRRVRWTTRALVIAFAVTLLGPPLVILPLHLIDPPTTAMILGRTWARWKDGKTPAYPKRETTSLEALGPTMPRAILAAEDDAFYLHFGFDFRQLEKAITESREKKRGASTITQQTAKNLFLWNGRSYVRKGLEAYLTLWLELLLPKDRILEIYLGLVECADGYFGVETCARHYYGRSASQLDANEAARLAAVLPRPRKITPNSDYAFEQAAAIEQRMSVPVSR